VRLGNLMESRVERYTFRLEVRGATADCGGRIVVDESGKIRLQVWMRSPEQANILLEVLECTKTDQLWKLFRKVCDYRGVRGLQYRQRTPEPGQWTDTPHAAGRSIKNSQGA
jgi:hypothetical protein